ncbi:MAG TPA: lysylphosphatidylglycerol synthase transmembrane domain-containing protein [Actinomycetota bacterium]
MSRSRLGRVALWVTGVGTTAVAGVLVTRYVDREALHAAWVEMRADPVGLTVAMGAYVAAFVVRGAIWKRMLPSLQLGHAVAAIHLTLLGNHVLPFRLGEPLRAASVTARAGVPIGPAIASTVAMRAADILGVAVLGLVLGPGIVVSLLGPWGLALMTAGALAVGVAGVWWLRRRYGSLSPLGFVRMPGPVVAIGALAAWVLESAVMWQSARWVGFPITPGAAVVATAITVGAQIAALAPAGFGTFEAAGTAALAAVGMPAGRALAVTLTVHAVTTVYSLVTGAVALVLPSPAMRPSLLLRALRSPHPADLAAGAGP